MTRVFINTEGDRHRVSRELGNFMEYISTGRAEDEYTRKLDEEVESLRRDDGKEALYMTYQQNIMEHELIARREGREEAMIKNIHRMFSRNFSLEDIAFVNDISIEQVERIINQTSAPC